MRVGVRKRLRRRRHGAGMVGGQHLKDALRPSAVFDDGQLSGTLTTLGRATETRKDAQAVVRGRRKVSGTLISGGLQRVNWWHGSACPCRAPLWWSGAIPGPSLAA